MGNTDRCIECGSVREVSAVGEDAIVSPRQAAKALAAIASREQEHFAVVLLNTRNQVQGELAIVAQGSVNVAGIQPRDVFRPALLGNATSIIVGHNHPSGDPTPSPEDVAVTHSLREAGRLLGIELLDHIVVASGRFVSLREQGQL